MTHKKKQIKRKKNTSLYKLVILSAFNLKIEHRDLLMTAAICMMSFVYEEANEITENSICLGNLSQFIILFLLLVFMRKLIINV